MEDLITRISAVLARRDAGVAAPAGPTAIEDSAGRAGPS
jgi:hypothetical protein